MILTLFLKDIKLLIRDLKFQIFFLILVVLFILSAISSSVTYSAFTQEYQNLLKTHQDSVYDENKLILRDMISNGRHITVIDVPSPALLFSVYENYPNRLSSKVMFYYPFYEIYSSTGTEVFRLNWYFILGIMSGFIMLLMSFEALSAEKRAGTLRLLSIHGFKRQAILWCKYLSYMLLYLIIVVPPALISIIIFFALTGTWSIDYMLKFILIIMLSIPFASFFIMLGIFISMAKNYRNAIVMVVSIWLLFVIIIPQSANIFGKQIAPIKTSTEYRQIQSKAYYEEWEIQNDANDGKANGNGNLQDGIRAKVVYASDEKHYLTSLQEQDDYIKQLNAIENIAQLSPFTQFEKIAEIVFDKGAYLLKSQQETMKNTITQVRNLIIEQDSRDETSLHLFYSWAHSDRFSGRDLHPFSIQKFENPNLLFVTNTQTDDAINKTLKIILRLLPILILNLILIIGSVVKLEKLDIR